MINSKISAALATKLNTLALPTHWENAKFTPTNGQIYLSESLLSGDTNPVGVSSAASDEFGGVYQVLVYAPLDANKGQAREPLTPLPLHSSAATGFLMAALQLPYSARHRTQRLYLATAL